MSSSISVAIVMGSRSDWDVMQHASDTLDQLGAVVMCPERLTPSPLRLHRIHCSLAHFSTCLLEFHKPSSGRSWACLASKIYLMVTPLNYLQNRTMIAEKYYIVVRYRVLK